VQTKTTIQILTICLVVSASIILSSCSTYNMLSSQNPRYHLNLVKAGRTVPSDNAKDNVPTADITPITHHGSMVSYSSDEELNNLTALLKSDVKQIEKQVKKSNPQVYKSIKNINITKAINQMAIPRSNYSKNKFQSMNSVNDQGYDLMRDTKGLFLIWISVLGAAIVLLLLASVSNIFLLFGFVVAAAFIIFFALWLLAVTGVPQRVE
jgi:hypothetical protein